MYLAELPWRVVVPLSEVPQEGSSVFSLFSLIKLHLVSHPLASSYSRVTVSSVFCAQNIFFRPSVWGPVEAALYTIVPRSPFLAFCTPKYCYKNDKKCGWLSASMKWRYLGYLQLLSRAVAVMAEMEVNPQEEMTNPPLRKMGFLEISCLFLLCVECNRRHS